MAAHYTNPRQFVGRYLAYAIYCDGWYWGHIVAGNCFYGLPGRNAWFGIDKTSLNHIVNNRFFHIERDGLHGATRYPLRNFAQAVLKAWREAVIRDWPAKYGGDSVLGFEALVEPPRTGDVYLRDGWTLLPKTTKGYKWERTTINDGGDRWISKLRRVETDILRPKLILLRRA
jgi:hypothetical protein